MSFTGSKNELDLAADDVPARLGELLRAGSRGSEGRTRMSPEMSYGRHAGPAPHTARRAAVMLLLFRRGNSAAGAGSWHLPLTQRPATLARHAGQVSLPGGAIDPSESSTQAALRELREELGVEGRVDVIGRLDDCYVFASDFLITPWIGVASFEPSWKPHGHEVERVVELPLDALLDDRNIGRITIERGPLAFHAPCLHVAGACIWGATCVILAELGDVLRQLRAVKQTNL
jgi:8-oxo-dGTP pyrophosphatase MutT (NUDIX family)